MGIGQGLRGLPGAGRGVPALLYELVWKGFDTRPVLQRGG